MSFLLSTINIDGLINLLYSILIFSILYITITKFNYITNVIIYAILRTIIPLILSLSIIEIFPIFILYCVLGLIIILIIGIIRQWFVYETIICLFYLYELLKVYFL